MPHINLFTSFICGRETSEYLLWPMNYINTESLRGLNEKDLDQLF